MALSTIGANGNPSISVIIPVYNAAATLAQALESIAAQTRADFEALCLNDGSTDNSLSILRAFAQSDSRFRVIDKENQGYGATCNRGIEESRGCWVSILEPDDWIEPDMFERMLSFAASFESPIDIVKTPYWRIVNPDTPQQEKLQCRYKGRVNPRTQPFPVGDGVELISHHPSIWSALYRREFLLDNQVRFREYPGAGWADNPFLLDTLCRTNRIIYLDEPFYCYREETEEKTRAFHTSNPLLPLERWNDMLDVLVALDERDERVLDAHCKRGFTYLETVLAFSDLSNESLRQAILRMFERMDERRVMNNPGIAPDMKRLYRSMLGLPEAPISSGPYKKYLVEEGVYTLRTNGLKSVVSTVRKRILHR